VQLLLLLLFLLLLGKHDLLRIEPVTVTRLRLRIIKSLAAPTISEFAAFKSPIS